LFTGREKGEYAMAFGTVGEIRISNTLFATEDCLAEVVALELLSTGFQIFPVLDCAWKVIGKVTEMDLLKVLRIGKDLRVIRIREIMAPPPPVATTEISLDQAVDIIDANHLIQLPVMKNGRFIGSVTRHDLLRAWLGKRMEHERVRSAEVLG
jgi:predicted transcriptional regulator